GPGTCLEHGSWQSVPNPPFPGSAASSWTLLLQEVHRSREADASLCVDRQQLQADELFSNLPLA
ncbi:hypothetical protein EWB00_000548, partial [Schistosoma japonicum]